MSEKITEFRIEGVPDADVNKVITGVAASWTLDAVSQVTVELNDIDMKMFLANYFQVRRKCYYRGVPFEIAATEISQGDGMDAKIGIEARRYEIQQIKRDKAPGSVSGTSATDYARAVATKFGLQFVGQPTAKKQSITKVTSGSAEESTWDVLQRAAGEAQFVIFESDGTLYFASEEWLLGKWANLTFTYPSTRTDTLKLMEMPTCRRSDDDPYGAQFQSLIDRTNAINLRPGMTITLSGMGEFDLQYLITEVEYAEGIFDPVAVSGRTAKKFKPQK